VPDTPGASGVPGDVTALRAENARLRDTVERQRMLLEDKDAKIAGLEAGNAELEKRVARLERWRRSTRSGLSRASRCRSGPWPAACSAVRVVVLFQSPPHALASRAVVKKSADLQVPKLPPARAGHGGMH
jgi:hypothetical protein